MIHRSKLRNKFLKDRTQEYQDACDKQRNLQVSCCVKMKGNYFGKLDIKIMTDNRKYLEKVNLLFFEKSFP